MSDAIRGGRLETAHRFAEEVLNDRHPEAVDELLTPTFRLHEGGHVTLEGREDAVGRILAVRTAFPEMRYYVLDRLVDGPLAVERWVLEGVHRRPFLGVRPSGRRVRLEGAVVARFDGARIAEAWLYWDRWTLLAQLGVVPAAPAPAGRREGPWVRRGAEGRSRSW